MNKKLIKDLSRELEALRANSVPLVEHNREVDKLKRDKANVTAALSTANKALERACEELRKAKPHCRGEVCGETCTRCYAYSFRCEVENGQCF